jgi:hypothetical protein
MKLPPEIQLFGTPDKTDTASESQHAMTFFAKLRREYPQYGAIATHIRNEGKRSAMQIQKQKAEGLTTGTADIIIPANPPFVCELKSRSPRATISNEQIEYLLNAQKLGAFACVAIGYEGAIEAFKKCYLLEQKFII